MVPNFNIALLQQMCWRGSSHVLRVCHMPSFWKGSYGGQWEPSVTQISPWILKDWLLVTGGSLAPLRIWLYLDKSFLTAAKHPVASKLFRRRGLSKCIAGITIKIIGGLIRIPTSHTASKKFMRAESMGNTFG